MAENELARVAVNECYLIHKNLGPGLLESVYEEILAYEFKKKGFNIERQKPIPCIWDGLKMDIGFRADIVLENKLILELKSIEALSPVHPKILLTYLKLADLKLGLLINFNVPLLKDGIKRIINGQLE